jgi:hypothetical protein
MPKALETHAAERIDKEDFEYGVKTFPRALADLRDKELVLVNQGYVLRGFRVELPDQTAYPGRVVIHGGFALDHDGRQLFNEQQLTVSRTITLEGGSTTFYIEIEFTESDSDVDSRAFWDPTVDQGTDVSGDALPDGQEFGNSVATRKTPDWQIVTPIRTDTFEYWIDPSSTKIPIIKLSTNTSNEITVAVNTGLATELPATTLLDELQSGPPTVLRVVDPQHFPVGTIFDLAAGTAIAETGLQVAAVDPTTGLITCTGGLTNPGSHVAGEILRATGGTAPTLVTEGFGRFLRLGWAPTRPDSRDKLFQGDEVHGDALSEGHDTTVDDQSSDVNVRALKQYVDFLSAQIAEMKWGHRTSFQDDDHVSRTPPGLANDIPANPRYFHKAGGIQGARTATITVGDGVTSWGDFVGADETGIQAAVANLPATGGTVVIRDGVYTLANDVVINKPVQFVGGPNTSILIAGGAFDCQLAAAVRVDFNHLFISRSSSLTGIKITTSSATSRFGMNQCILRDVSLDLDASLQDETYISKCRFYSISASMAGRALVRTTVAGAAIKGVWSDCVFEAVYQTGIAAACIDTTTSTTGFSNASFVGCVFSNSLVCTSQIDMGSATQNASFERCVFSEGLPTVLGTAAIVSTDPNNLSIKNCRFSISSSTSLTTSAIYIDSASGWSENVTIENNFIEADSSDLVTGIVFDVSAGSGVRGVDIVDNKIKECEVGIFFTATAGTGNYWNVTIRGNHLYDRGGGSTTASNQRAGILLDNDHNRLRWHIVDNVIENVNPADTNPIGALTTRAGIWARSAGAFVTDHMTVRGNQIRRIGDGANAVTNTLAIRIDNPGSCVVDGNTIEDVDGTDAVGILMGTSAFVAEQCVVANNILTGFDSAAGNCFPIAFGSAIDLVVSGNTIKDYDTSSGTSSGIRWDSSAAGSCEEVTITGNKIFSDASGVDHGIRIEALNILRVTISNNVIRGGSMTQGITLLADAVGGSIQQISIVGNVVRTTTRSLIVNASPSPKANCEHLSIVGNTLETSGTSTNVNIWLEHFEFVQVTGNTILNAGIDNASRNVYVEDVSYFVISSNTMRTGDFAYNIYLNTGSTHWIVNNNLLDGSTGAGQTSIHYGFSSHGLSQAIVTLNLADSAVVAAATAADAADHVLTTATGNEISQY